MLLEKVSQTESHPRKMCIQRIGQFSEEGRKDPLEIPQAEEEQVVEETLEELVAVAEHKAARV